MNLLEWRPMRRKRDRCLADRFSDAILALVRESHSQDLAAAP
jgi:hypothetical protein